MLYTTASFDVYNTAEVFKHCKQRLYGGGLCCTVVACILHTECSSDDSVAIGSTYTVKVKKLQQESLTQLL